MSKQEYSTPELTVYGSLEELTAGDGLRGNDDSISLWFITISWGTDPSGS